MRDGVDVFGIGGIILEGRGVVWGWFLVEERVWWCGGEVFVVFGVHGVLWSMKKREAEAYGTFVP